MHIAAIPLEDRFVRLEPLAERHREGVRLAAEADQDIWTIYPVSMIGEHFAPYWKQMMALVESDASRPFAVMRGDDCVGVSSLMPDFPNRTVEIGGTYYRPDARGGPVNPACKRLMMAHAFDNGAIRVGFKVDVLNARSRAAVLKLGAVQEGILRQDRTTWTGRIRDTVVFSVLADEWPGVRDRLDIRLAGLS